MGVISRKIFPECGSMCVCCTALRSRSRQPVKCYKKLLTEIFPKSPVDGTYIHNIDNFAGKVCMLSCKSEDENQKCGLRASSLRCLLAMVFPEALFIQLLKVMLRTDVEIRVGGHQIFCFLLIPNSAHARNDAFDHPRSCHSESASTFSSITALLEKLRLEIYGTKVKQGRVRDDYLKVEEEWMHGRSHNNSPKMHIISSIVDRTNGPVSFTDTEQYFLRCNEDQILQLLSALWIQVSLLDNMPANIEAIAHSFCLALISSCLKNTNNNLLLKFFQLSTSIRKISLDSNNGSLPPAYQRSLLVLSTAMMMFAAKLYNFTETRNLLNLLLESNVDPYVGISDDS